MVFKKGHKQTEENKRKLRERMLGNTLSLEKWNLDKVRTQELEGQGYNVIRLWERDINKMDINQFQEKVGCI